MANELVQLSDFISIVETVVLLIASYIGAIVHEYFFISGKTKFIKNPRIWLIVIMNFIICYSINPYIIEFNPRLILLPPLILGLLGNELAVRMGTIEGSTSFIEYILGFFGIKNKLTKEEKESLGVKEHREIPDPLLVNKSDNTNTDQQKVISNNNIKKEIIIEEQKKEFKNKLNLNNQANFNLNTEENDKIKNINRAAYRLFNELEALILNYCNNTNSDDFIKKYVILKSKIQQFNMEFKTFEYLPLNTTLKISEILDKEKDLDKIYKKLTSLKIKNNK